MWLQLVAYSFIVDSEVKIVEAEEIGNNSNFCIGEPLPLQITFS